MIGKILKISLIRDLKNYLSVAIIVRIIALFLMPIYFRMISIDTYGKLVIFDSFLSIIGTIVTLGMNNSIIIYLNEHREKIGSFLYTQRKFIFITFIPIALFCLLFSNIIFKPLGVDFITLVMILVTLLPTNLGIAYIAYIYADKRSFEKSMIDLVTGILKYILPISVILIFSHGVYFKILVTIAATAWVLYGYIHHRLKKIEVKKFDVEQLKYSIAFGLPLVPNTLSTILLFQVDRIIINQFCGMEKAGIYSFANTVATLYYQIIPIILFSLSPYIFDYIFKKKVELYSNIFKVMSVLCGIGAILTIIFDKYLILIFGASKYLSALEMIPLLSLNSMLVINILFFSILFRAIKKTYIISLTTIVGGIANIILNYALIPHYGYQIAVETTFVSFAIVLVLNFIFAKFYKLEVKFFYENITVMIILVGVILIVEKFIKVELLKDFIESIFIIILLGYLGFYARKVIVKFKSKQI